MHNTFAVILNSKVPISDVLFECGGRKMISACVGYYIPCMDINGDMMLLLAFVCMLEEWTCNMLARDQVYV